MKARLSMFALIAAASCNLHAADSGRVQAEALSADQAERKIAGLTAQQTTASVYIWTDRYTYRPGQTVTVRMTMNANNDFYPYTVVAYRVNNQTGVRSFFPNGGGEVTDVVGRTFDQGFSIGRLQTFNKVVFGNPFPAPNELGMHTIAVELRDYTGTQVVKTVYAKFGVVDGEETISGNIESSRELVNTKQYNLSGVVFVKGGAVLTIQPGTFIFGQPGAVPAFSALVVTKTGRIVANGTRSRPIIMTSSQPFGQRQRGDWGGLVLLGNAPTNQSSAGRFAEGLDQTADSSYGGDDATHNCGTLRYLRVEYAGVAVNQNNEVNAISWYSCGTQTVSEYLQATHAADDSFEWFGGTNSAKHLVTTYGDDDGFDFSFGWSGNLQYGLYVAGPEVGSRGIEADNHETAFGSTPPTRPTLFNLTLIGNGRSGTEDSSLGALLRRGVQGSINNTIFQNFGSAAIQVTDAPTEGNLDANTLTANGVLLWNNSILTSGANTIAGQVHTSALAWAQGTRGTGRQFTVADPGLRRPLGYSGGDWRPSLNSPVFRANWVLPPDNGFFDQSAKFIGAFGDHDWTEEWTNFLLEEDIQLTAQ